MTKSEFKKRLKTYIKNNVRLDEKIEKVINSGCIDLENKEDNWRLEKAAAYAICLSIAEDFRPLHSQTRKEAKNIELFI